jgi:hypothetical protein
MAKALGVYMKTIFCLAAILIILSCNTLGTSFIPDENQVILSKIPMPLRRAQMLQLSTSDIKNVPSDIYNYLKNYSISNPACKPIIDQITARFNKYYVQYFGMTVAEKRFILCSFFLSIDSFPNWRSDLVGESEIGVSYWQFSYCIDDQSFNTASIGCDY